MKKIAVDPTPAAKFFHDRQNAMESKLSPKAQKVRDNIHGWPSHIGRGPLFTLAGLLLNEKIHATEKGFKPFSFRTVVGTDNHNTARWPSGTTVMVMTRFGESSQPACDAKQIRLNQSHKYVISWDSEASRPATDEEIAQFFKDAFQTA